MKAGILGLQGSGKSTVFDILVGGSDARPRDGGAMRQGVCVVPDERVDRLAAHYRPRKVTHARLELVDLGAVPASTRGGGVSFPPDFLAQVRTLDALLVVIRMFEDESVYHPLLDVDPARDYAIVRDELLLSDLQVVEKRIERLSRNVARGLKEEKAELELFERLKEALEQGRPLRELELEERELRALKGYAFLTLKPWLCILNMDEDAFRRRDELVGGVGAEVPVLPICAAIEREIAELDEDDAALFMEDLGLREKARDRIVRATYELLGLISFFTVGEDEVKAWTLRRGSTALAAAAAIHSDLARGFIRAEVFSYDDFVSSPDVQELRKRGLWRLEGKEYVVRDGDVVHVRFNA